MKTITKTYNVYQFDELSEESQEKVKEWYLSIQEPCIFEGDCCEDLENLFPNSVLDIQFSLNYCQGDGFNIYGNLLLSDLLTCIQSQNAGELKQFCDFLTEKEIKTIAAYEKELGKIELPQNNRYCYCMSHYIDFSEDWLYSLEMYKYKNINSKAIKKAEKLVKQCFKVLCDQYEKNGYDYFYEISKEDLSEICNGNEWYFTESGKLEII